MPAFWIGAISGAVCFCIGYGTACFMYITKKREEKHAEWIEDIYGFCKCSNCGRLEEINYDYCCDCGAKMNKKSNTSIMAFNAETCVYCGVVIPEGRQVCPKCEKEGK